MTKGKLIQLLKESPFSDEAEVFVGHLYDKPVSVYLNDCKDIEMVVITN